MDTTPPPFPQQPTSNHRAVQPDNARSDQSRRSAPPIDYFGGGTYTSYPQHLSAFPQAVPVDSRTGLGCGLRLAEAPLIQTPTSLNPIAADPADAIAVPGSPAHSKASPARWAFC